MKVAKNQKQGLFGRKFRASPREGADAKSMIEYLGYRALAPDGVLYLKDGSVARFLKIQTTDLFSLDLAGKNAFIDAFTDFNRTYTYDYKIVVLSTRIDTQAQQMYWRHLRMLVRQNTTSKTDVIRLKLIRNYLSKMIQLERETVAYSDIQFYIMIFADSLKKLELNTRSAIYADPGKLNPRPLNRKDTEQVLFRENNLNSK